MVLWLLSVRLRKIKKYDIAFDDKTDYVVCINNVMQGIATYFEKANGSTFERALIQCEYIFYGIKTANDLIKDINTIRNKLDKAERFRTIKKDFNFGEPEYEGPLQSTYNIAEESKRVFEKANIEKFELENLLKSKEEELGDTLVEIAYPSLDKLLVYHDNMIHIERERYYQKAIFEYWEPNLEHERYMKEVTYGGDIFKLLPNRLKEEQNISDKIGRASCRERVSSPV